MSNSSAQEDFQRKLAQERTETAHRRTLLAEERTCSAWIRTGLAALATGLVIVKLMGDSGPSWLIRALGVLFVVASGVMFVLGFWAYRRALRNMRGKVTGGIPLWVIGTLTTALVVGATTGLVIIFLE